MTCFGSGRLSTCAGVSFKHLCLDRQAYLGLLWDLCVKRPYVTHTSDFRISCVWHGGGEVPLHDVIAFTISSILADGQGCLKISE